MYKFSLEEAFQVMPVWKSLFHLIIKKFFWFALQLMLQAPKLT